VLQAGAHYWQELRLLNNRLGDPSGYAHLMHNAGVIEKHLQSQESSAK